MDKIREIIEDNIWWIMIVSLVLMVIGCIIVGCFDLDPLWYIVPFVLGLGVLIPFVCLLVFCAVLIPIAKIKDRIANRKK